MSSEGASSGERLLAACRSDSVEQINQVLEDDSMVDVNVTDAIGNTPLHLAAQSGSSDCIALLLKLDSVELNPKNIMDRNTPLHLAIINIEKFESLEAAQNAIILLLKYGADPKLTNKDGLKPVQLLSNLEEFKAIREALFLRTSSLNVDVESEDDDDDDDEGASSD